MIWEWFHILSSVYGCVRSSGTHSSYNYEVVTVTSITWDGTPALGERSLTHWTTREVPVQNFRVAMDCKTHQLKSQISREEWQGKIDKCLGSVRMLANEKARSKMRFFQKFLFWILLKIFLSSNDYRQNSNVCHCKHISTTHYKPILHFVLS